MYVGRIVAVGRNRKGQLAALYRVSSRSYPNREAQIKDNAVVIVPKKGSEGDVFKSPYIAYNCLRIAGRTAVATNGSQTDAITEKIAAGMPPRDAFTLSLLALDYEKDSYNTPRIAAAVTAGGDAGYLGVVREDGLDVCRLKLEPGECFFVSTYETNRVSRAQRGEFDAADAREGAEFIFRGGVFAEMTNAVTGVCAIEKDGRFEIAVAQA
ncbi:MAG: IMP cyclohydrolase [Candidatus Brocadiia bacterium]|jgi:IMP cyclohydrolase